jgi:uncharacterized membrane protein
METLVLVGIIAIAILGGLAAMLAFISIVEPNEKRQAKYVKTAFVLLGIGAVIAFGGTFYKA